MKVVDLPAAAVSDDTSLIATLLDMLRRARMGEVMGFALVMMVDEGEEYATHNAAVTLEPDQKLRLLGAIRRLEHRFERQEWPEG